MSPIAVPNGHSSASSSLEAGPSTSSAKPTQISGKSGKPPSGLSSTQPLWLSRSASPGPAHLGRIKTGHFLDLSETEHYGSASGSGSGLGDGTRTPRPGNFTPSPPRTRSNSVNRQFMRDPEPEVNGEGTSSASGSEPESGSEAEGMQVDLSEDALGVKRSKSRTKSASKSKLKSKLDARGKLWKEDEGETARLMRTIDFAARKHTCQRRKDLDQTPYINHPIAVANFLSSTGITDVRVLQAAILHDTVEDTPTTLEEIEQHFGAEVARIVQECTDDPDLSAQARKSDQIRTAPYKSREAQQVKLADKLHNLESIRRAPPVGWTVRRVQAYFIWAKQVTDICGVSHAPLAQRLQRLYETAYTEIDGKYFPCHPDVAGPLLEEEKLRIDGRLRHLKKGEKPCPHPIFF